MSINIALVPLGMVMYTVMGADRFQDFVSQSEIVKYTKYKKINQIEKYVRMAGYDFITQYGMKKTHYKNKGFFMWEQRNGYICAVFSKYDDAFDILDFITAFENIIGENSLYNDISEINNGCCDKTDEKILNTEIVKPLTEQTFKTKFVDREILLKVLKKIGLNCTQKNNEIICNNGNYKFIFSNNEGFYEFRIIGDISNNEAYLKYKNVDFEYGKEVQNNVVQNIKNKVDKNKSMNLESEEILEDDSIVLTINL